MEECEEIPFTFGARKKGASKLKEKTIVEYGKQVIDLARFSIRNKNSPAYAEIHRAVKFMVVGFTGVVVNVGFLFFLTERFGLYYLLSGLIGIEASIISNFFLNDLWTFGDIEDKIFTGFPAGKVPGSIFYRGPHKPQHIVSSDNRVWDLLHHIRYGRNCSGIRLELPR